jgi:hypothetical protein
MAFLCRNKIIGHENFYLDYSKPLVDHLHAFFLSLHIFRPPLCLKYNKMAVTRQEAVAMFLEVTLSFFKSVFPNKRLPEYKYRLILTLVSKTISKGI